MFRLFNLKVKKREFGYQPRYYDADKEALEKRIRARESNNKDGELTKARLKREFGSMRGGARTSSNGSFLQSSSFVRLIAIIAILCIISYLVLDHWLPEFMRMLFPQEYMQQEILEPYDGFDE